MNKKHLTSARIMRMRHWRIDAPEKAQNFPPVCDGSHPAGEFQSRETRVAHNLQKARQLRTSILTAAP